MSDNTHVPDKLEGYMLQVRHALYELICLDERVVSVEAYDDVAVEKTLTKISGAMCLRLILLKDGEEVTTN